MTSDEHRDSSILADASAMQALERLTPLFLGATSEIAGYVALALFALGTSRGTIEVLVRSELVPALWWVRGAARLTLVDDAAYESDWRVERRRLSSRLLRGLVSLPRLGGPLASCLARPALREVGIVCEVLDAMRTFETEEERVWLAILIQHGCSDTPMEWALEQIRARHDVLGDEQRNGVLRTFSELGTSSFSRGLGVTERHAMERRIASIVDGAASSAVRAIE